MAWAKLKNIILLLLVCTNLALAAFVVQREAREDLMHSQARENAIAFLETRGIRLERGQIPNEMTLTAQSVERDLEAERLCASALLGGDTTVESLGGEVYRCRNDRGCIQFHSDGSFAAQLVPGAYPLGPEREDTCLKLLRLLNFEGEYLGETENGMTFRQSWERSPLFTQQVTLTFEKDCVTGLVGGRLVGQPTANPGRTSIDVPTALFSFYNGLKALGDVCSSIDGVVQGYEAENSPNGPMEMTPVWWITTDTGEYRLNSVTGALSRVRA